jgi:hypothetical protein
MPSIIYIYPPHSPVRRIPKSVRMNQVDPSPWECVHCNKLAITYADGGVWCNTCEKKLLDADRRDISRGEQINKETPPWVKIELNEL